MERLVCDLWWGACVSKDVLGFGLSATFTGSYRTKEFREQEWFFSHFDEAERWLRRIVFETRNHKGNGLVPQA